MRHCFVIIDGASPSATCSEALPDMQLVDKGDWSSVPEGPEAILWCRVPQGGDVEAVIAEIKRYSALPIVILEDEPSDASAVKAIGAGASGLCNAHAAPEVLRQVAVVVENGGLWIGRSLVQRLVTGTSRLLAGRDTHTRERWSDKLSEREREVALRVADGASNREIADQLFITERTVKAHLSTIFEKLGVRDRLQLSLRANGVHL